MSTTALSAGEQLDLTALETVVREGLATFIEVGQALAEIRDRRLYRASHATFEEYCHERWLLSRTRVYQLIDAANVGEVMSTMVDTQPPANERQARELATVLRDEGEEAVVEVWRELRNEFGDDLTAKRVRTVVRNRLKRMEREREAEQRRAELSAKVPREMVFPGRVPNQEALDHLLREQAMRRGCQCLDEARGWLEEATASFREAGERGALVDVLLERIDELALRGVVDLCDSVRVQLDDASADAEELAEHLNGDGS
jgi:hypothetical protein